MIELKLAKVSLIVTTCITVSCFYRTGHDQHDRIVTAADARELTSSHKVSELNHILQKVQSLSSEQGCTYGYIAAGELSYDEVFNKLKEVGFVFYKMGIGLGVHISWEDPVPPIVSKCQVHSLRDPNRCPNEVR